MSESMHLSKLCRLFDQSYHQEEAVLNDGVTWTYGEVYDLIKNESEQLKEVFSGTKKMSLLLYLPSDFQFVTYFFSTITSGHIPFTCSLDLKKELVGLLKHVSGIITTDEGLENLKKFADLDHHQVFIANETRKVGKQKFVDPVIDPYKVMVQGHSSGSTGEPKVINSVLMKFYENIREYHKVDIFQQGDVVLSLAPLGHMYGMAFGMLAPFYLGLKIKTTKGGFNFSDVLKPEVTEGVQVVISTPPVYQFLAEMLGTATESTGAFRDTRVLVSAAAKFEKKVSQMILEKLKVKIVDIFGSTEAIAIAHRNLELEDLWQFFPGTIWRMDEENGLELNLHLSEGKDKVWYKTGDILELDPASAEVKFSLKSRSQDFVKIAGVRVFTFEIQNALKECEEVKDVVVLPHPTKEEAIALVQLVSDEANGLPRLRAFCKNNIAPTRTPSRFIVLDQLPRNSVGKINMNELREMVKSVTDKEDA